MPTIATFLTLTALAAGPDAPVLDEPAWAVAAKSDGVTVYVRTPKGSPVQDMKATGVVDAEPMRVWQAIRDYENYAKTMPFTEVSQVLSREDEGKVTYFYSVVSAPFVSKRDYIIRAQDVSEWKDGAGFLKVIWSATDRGPPERKDVVRVKMNEGYWLLEPHEGGKKTLATYRLYTDPGGSIPKWLVNRANGSAVPDVFKAVRKVATAPPSAAK